MENLSKKNKVVIEAFGAGYDITKDGHLVRKDKTIKSEFNGSINGYLYVSLRLPTVTRAQVLIHKLQAYKKFGNAMFEYKIVIRHKNGIRTDNSWDNILIGTASDNQMDIPKEVRVSSATTASRKMQNQLRSYEERYLIYEDIWNKIPYSEIMLKHNISSKGTLSFMKNKSIEYKEYIMRVSQGGNMVSKTMD